MSAGREELNIGDLVAMLGK